MGADLIGYFAKGPERIPKDEAKEDVVVDGLVALHGWLKPFEEHFDLHSFDPSTLFSDEVMATCPVTLEISDDVSAMGELYGMLTPPEGVSVQGHIKKLVRDLLESWPPEFRDSAWMPDPDDPLQIMAFAGTQTWGDEPEGGGYDVLKQLGYTGVGAAFGIRTGCSFVTIRLTP